MAGKGYALPCHLPTYDGNVMNGQELPAVAFGLAAAISWGAGDFSGGLASRRAPMLRVLLLTQAIGLALLVALALLRAEPLPPPADLAWGAAAGLAGLLGVGTLYRGMTVGKMGVVAPISAVLAAGLPVVFGALTEGLPAPLKVAGFLLALAGIWLVSRGSAGDGLGGVGWAMLSGAAFGVYFILLDRAGATAVFWPLVAGRVASLLAVLAAALATGNARLPDRRLLPLIVLPAVLEIAGNTCFVLATQSGRLDVASVLSSLYPASTVILARLVLGERMAPRQAAGVVTVLGAIGLIAA